MPPRGLQLAVDLQDLSRRLFQTANQLWTNSTLRPDQYAQPVLALIALRQMEAKFDAVHAELNQSAQRLDRIAQRLGRPSNRLHSSRHELARLQHQLHSGFLLAAQHQRSQVRALALALPSTLQRALRLKQDRLDRQAGSLVLLDPQLVLERGYAYVTDETGNSISRTTQTQPGQTVRCTLSDGRIDLTVQP